MAIIKKSELKKLDQAALNSKLNELKKELNLERGKIFAKSKVQSPGKIREIKKTIARILTLLNQKTKNLRGEK
ncbi:MAG: 50S ribosomal protein L29 [Candidatus Micrarchaeota archaeon]|nr:50S ribosomal protein L29 [Candidatus Micrarchaeota archaeon]